MTTAVTTAAAAYMGPHLYQGATTPCPWQNCAPTTHAVLVDCDWLGAKRGTATMAGTIRHWIEIHYGIGCVGTTLIQNETAISAQYGTSMTHKWDIDPATIRSALLGGYKVAGIEQYWVWHGTPWDHSPTFNGGHNVAYKAARYYSGQWQWRRGDPMSNVGDQWVPESLAIKALAATFTDHNAEFSITRCFAASAAKKVLYAHDTLTGIVGAIRASSTVSSASLGSVHIGQLLTHAGSVTGGSWTVNGKGGSVWLKVTAINGTSVSKLFPGHSVVYVALGWVTGPTGAA